MPLLAALGVLFVMTIFMRNGAMFRTAVTMLLKWFASTAIIFWLDNDHPWAWFALFDTMAAIIITVRPAGKMQASIGGIYVAMILCHAVYGTTTLLGEFTDTSYYLNTLDILEVIAIGLLGAWVGGRGALVGIGWVADRVLARKNSADAIKALLAGMD